MDNRPHLLAVASLLCLALAGPLQADPRETGGDLAEQIGKILAETYAGDEPGAAVIVVDDGEVIYRGARGMANLELGVPLEPDMVLRLGSITKQFTAAAILLLQEAGKLSVADPITRYLPDYPVHGHTITIEHLLTHTSGIFNYTAIPGYMESKIRRDLTTDELIDEFKTQEMDFAPGERWSYSNSGYVLLGAIIEKVAGVSYAELVEKRIFDPLGMAHSHYGGPQLIPRRVAGYEHDGDGYVNAPYLSMTQPHAAGALLSSVDDLARWDAALYGDGLLSAASKERMFAEYQRNDGEGVGYGYGFVIGSFRGSPSISHGGGIPGFRTYAIRLPAEKVYVAVLSNGSTVNTSTTAQKIAALTIGKPFPEWQRLEVAPEILASYAGVYRIDEDNTRSVFFEDGHLYTQRSGGQRLEALPHSENGFYYEDSFTHFEIVSEDGEVRMLMYIDGSDEPEVAVKTDEPVATREVAAADPNLYDRYVGRYQLRPGFELVVTREDDRLFTQATGQPKVEVFPESENRFFLKVVDAQLTFVVGEGGKAEAVVLHQAGLELRGERVD